MAAGSQRPRGAGSNVDYWLRRCEGFRVDSPQGPVGVVEEVRYRSRLDRPDVIGVRARFPGRLLLIVPVGEVAEILPRDELIVLRRSPRLIAAQRSQDRREPVQPRGQSETATGEVEGVGADAEGIETQREVRAVITRLAQRIGLRRGRGGEREMTPDVEASAEPSAEEASAEEASAEAQAGEEPAAAEAPAEATAEAVPVDERAAEEPPAEEPAAEE